MHRMLLSAVAGKALRGAALRRNATVQPMTYPPPWPDAAARRRGGFTRAITRAITWAVLCMFPLFATGAHAEDKFPSRPIRMVVAAPPGGGVDITARYLAELVTPILGQKVLVVNRPGGNGAVGIGGVLHDKPDGYSLAAAWPGPITILPHTVKLSYDLDDMTPIIQVAGDEPFGLCVRSSFPASDGKTFVDVIRQNPNKFTYGNDGVGNGVNLAVEGIARALGLKLRPIPFGGSGETLVAVLGGQIDIYAGSIPTILPNVQSGAAKCLLVTTAGRTPTLPDTMSLDDLGIPQAAAGSWNGVIGPKGMPAATVAILSQAYGKAVATDKFRQFVASRGQAVVTGTPDDFSRRLHAEYQANADLVAALGLQRK
jgi:tripartite-type tricarboxylate transporter receptor subunit TctC